MTHVLVVASTFPTSDSDPVPAFVKDQIKAMKKADTSLEFAVLAPHDSRSNTKSFTKHSGYSEYRFHYAFPRSLEKLAGRGIMPALEANLLNYALILPLFIGEFIALYRLTKRLKPDVIYAHWFTPQVVITSIVSKLTGTPFVFTTHASDVKVWHKLPVIGPLIVRTCAPKAQKITAVSRRSMGKLQSFFDDATWEQLKPKVAVIPMGVDIVPASSANTDPNSLLFIGRLAEKKGVQYLLPAFKKVLSEHPEAKLTIAGDGPWLKKLTDQAIKLDLSENVTFPGYTTGSDKKALLQKATFYLVPSIITDTGDAEGLPVSLMEGMSSGKVCIATNESGADDILTNDKDGFLLPEKNIDELAATITKAFALSPTERNAIAKEAVATSQQFNWATIAHKHISFFELGK